MELGCVIDLVITTPIFLKTYTHSTAPKLLYIYNSKVVQLAHRQVITPVHTLFFICTMLAMIHTAKGVSSIMVSGRRMPLVLTRHLITRYIAKPTIWIKHWTTVYPKKYAHGFCFAVLCCGYTLTDFPISFRLTSLALWQSNDCPSASKQPWWIWINTSCEFIMNDCITTTKQSTTTPCG